MRASQTGLHRTGISVDSPWEPPWFDPSAPVEEIVSGRVFKLNVRKLVFIVRSLRIEAEHCLELSFCFLCGGMAAVTPQVRYIGQQRCYH